MRRFSGFMSEEEEHRWRVSWRGASLSSSLLHHFHQFLPPHIHLFHWESDLNDYPSEKWNFISKNAQIGGKKNYNPYTESLDNIVIWVPGYTTGHLDACSVALSVPKAHMGHLVSCSAATDSPKGLLVNSTSLSYNADRYNAEDAMISWGLTRIDRYGMSILEAQLRLSGFETKL